MLMVLLSFILFERLPLRHSLRSNGVQFARMKPREGVGFGGNCFGEGFSGRSNRILMMETLP